MTSYERMEYLDKEREKYITLKGSDARLIIYYDDDDGEPASTSFPIPPYLTVWDITMELIEQLMRYYDDINTEEYKYIEPDRITDLEIIYT